MASQDRQSSIPFYYPKTRKFWSVGIGHMTNDIFMSAGIVVLTFLSATVLPMSNTQIGLAISGKQLAGAFTQPFFGLRADKTGGRWIGAGGLAWVVVTFALAIFLAVTTQNYIAMLIPFVLQGLGSGAVHPVGALHAAEADDDHVATNTAFFFLMGQMGLGLGPWIVGMLLDVANRGAGTANVMPLLLMVFAAIPSILLMFGGIPATRGEKAKNDKAKNDDRARPSGISWSALAPFGIIALLVILRSLAQPGSVNFIPKLFQEKGWSPTEYGAIISFFWVASAISGVVLGNLADRFDRRKIIMISMVGSAPMFFFLPLVDGYLAFVLAILAGGLSGGAHSIIVVLAQEFAPNAKGFASGSILGFIFGMGALGSFLIGAVSDVIGLGVTFQFVAVAAVAAGLMGLLLPKPGPR
jgi:MFS transporter, FSR family, fosmidomycin resistance protein